MMPRNSQKGVRKFIGSINEYLYMWSRRLYMLATLAKLLSSKVKFKWTEVKQNRSNKLNGLWPTTFY